MHYFPQRVNFTQQPLMGGSIANAVLKAVPSVEIEAAATILSHAVISNNSMRLELIAAPRRIGVLPTVAL